VDVAASFIASGEPAEGVQPGEGAFDDPAPAAEAGAVRGLAARDAVLDAALAQQPAMGVGVIAAVGDQQRGTLAGSSGTPADARDAIEQREQLGDVVAVGAGHRPAERQPDGVDDQMVFRAQPPTIDRARARLRAPFLACT
jgi:hypothetical protein